MPTVKSRLAVLSSDPALHGRLAEHDPVILSAEDLAGNRFAVDVLVLDAAPATAATLTAAHLALLSQKKETEFRRVVLVLPPEGPVPAQLPAAARGDHYIAAEELTADFLHTLWQDLSQKEQEEAYLNLSAELNQQYEMLRAELESKLDEKSRNLIESRKQIFEINNRVEILRRSLYATTEVKNLAEAESILNDLLVGFNIITWLKIVPFSEAARFEQDLRTQLDSHFYGRRFEINQDAFVIYFFKGDRRAFRKPDLNYFDKLTEALQINLNRYNNLLALQQNERLFDLAFHSSPYPITIIDANYTVFQANLAAEKKAPDGSQDNEKCHQLLFGRKKPCVGCQLGSRFEIQQGVRTYAVQSSKFDNLIDTERDYWIHMYEDISEEKALESKFQQTARLSELGLISSSIAHELNNPLGGILSYLQIMKMELAADHPFQEDIRFLTDAANRMKKHIEDLLFFSRKEDVIKIEEVELTDVFGKNLDLLQMQLKKEHLFVSYQEPSEPIRHGVSILHFRNIIHLVFQFFLHKLKFKRQNKPNFSGLVEVKISQDQINSYLSFASNLGPHDLKLNSNDLSLITLEKSLLDQGFQLVISEPQPQWLQLLIKMPL